MEDAEGGRSPLILEIKGNSLDDGPGIRTVVFFKGCPLSCAWCHNPESRRTGPELTFDAHECVACDECLVACERGALDRSTPGFVLRDSCDLCFRCVDVCPSGALARVGKAMTVEEVVDACLIDRPFFETSGGGVTLSGGEPTMFMDYCSRLLSRLKAEGVDTIVETCGMFDEEEFFKEVLPFTDAVYFDLKIMDPDRHQELCGASNVKILSNFRALLEESRKGDFEFLARIPLVPGMTANVENLSAAAAFLRDTGAGRAALLSYNPLWLEKSRKIGRPEGLERDERMTGFMRPAEVRASRDIFEGILLVD